MEQIGNININFSVFSDDPKYLNVSDLSDWVYAENKPAFISIQMPGSKNEKNFPFRKKYINTFNSHNLGLSCLKGDCTEEVYMELPDGIYNITLSSSFKNILKKRFYLKTDRFEIEYSKVMIKYGFEIESREFLFHMLEVKGFLEVAKSHALLGDFVKSQRFFEEAKKGLNQYLDCINCL